MVIGCQHPDATTIPRLAVQAPPSHTLREVVHALAPLERRAGSDGEHQAARWLADRLHAAGAETRIEAEQFHDGYARVIGTLAAASAVAGAVVSKPTAKKTTWRVGFFCAITTASSGE